VQLDGERSEHKPQQPLAMHDRVGQSPQRRRGLRLLALLAIPLFLLLHAPVLAALVPGALLTIASLESLEHDHPRALPAASLVTQDDHLDLRRIAAATSVAGTSRRIG
jgi:hypothetical protein